MADHSEIKETLSAFIDAEAGELESRRLLKELSAHAGLRDTWERYYLIRAVLQKDAVPALPRNLAAKISDRVDKEAVSVRPAARFSRFARFVTGAAVAASVATLAIVSLQTFYSTPTDPSGDIKAKVAQTDLSGDATPKVAQNDFIRADRVRWDTDRPETESALNVYLVEHNEFMPTNNMGGMFPYVRVVTYDSEK